MGGGIIFYSHLKFETLCTLTLLKGCSKMLAQAQPNVMRLSVISPDANCTLGYEKMPQVMRNLFYVQH